MTTVGLVDRPGAPRKETGPLWHWQHPSVAEALADILLLVKGLFAVTDPRLWDHSVRVGKVCRTMAELLGLSAERTDLLEAAGYLHCIGLLGRLGPGSTCVGVTSPDAEMHDVVDHGQSGFQILSEIPRLVDLGPLILLSNRRWDRQEMLLGPQGNPSAVEAGVLSVIDAFDRAVHGLEGSRLRVSDALDRIRKGGGTLFDPKVVGAFMDACESTLTARDLWGDPRLDFE